MPRVLMWQVNLNSWTVSALIFSSINTPVPAALCHYLFSQTDSRHTFHFKGLVEKHKERHFYQKSVIFFNTVYSLLLFQPRKEKSHLVMLQAKNVKFKMLSLLKLDIPVYHQQHRVRLIALKIRKYWRWFVSLFHWRWKKKCDTFFMETWNILWIKKSQMFSKCLLVCDLNKKLLL